MEQLSAVWLIIVLALVTANLPFALERPLLVLPWSRRVGGTNQSFWTRWLESLAFFVLLVALAYVVPPIIGTAVFSGSDPASILLFMAKLLGVIVAAFFLLSYAGWRAGRASPAPATAKSFFVRLLEVLVLYVLVGMLGFGFERNIGNPFAQGWEFYAITVCLFVVLGYPGFVFRYLLRAQGRRKG